jgi:hypothetical protein
MATRARIEYSPKTRRFQKYARLARLTDICQAVLRGLARLANIRQAVLRGLARLSKGEFGECYANSANLLNLVNLANLASLANLESVG